MKIFQVMNGFCHWDATRKHPTLKSTENLYAPDIVFVEAPDYVFESWGFDPGKEGDERFIKPTPPEGWLYDDATGTFYPENETAPSKAPTPEDDINAMLVDLEYRMTLLELGVNSDAVQSA